MAYISTHAPAPLSSLGTLLKTAGATFASFVGDIVIAQDRSAEIQRLQGMTDHDLATKYGIKRTGIVSYVFQDKMF